MIDDGSGPTQLEDEIYNTVGFFRAQFGSGATLSGRQLVSVTGVVRYSHNSYEVHPRDRFDINVEAHDAVRRRDVYMEEVFEEMTDGINAMTDGQLHALLHRMTASEEALDGVQDLDDDTTHVGAAASRLARLCATASDPSAGSAPTVTPTDAATTAATDAAHAAADAAHAATAALWLLIVLILLSLAGGGFVYYRLHAVGRGRTQPLTRTTLGAPLAANDSASLAGSFASPTPL